MPPLRGPVYVFQRIGRQLVRPSTIAVVERNYPQDLNSALRLPEGHERTAALAAWIQSLFPAATPTPVLVGGAAVEIYSGGTYSTGDLDFVGTVLPEVARLLEVAGFERQGRHWIHEAGQIFVEFPGSHLEPPEQAIRVQVGPWEVLALSPEDVLIDRLAAWQFWSSPLDGVAAFHLWQRLGRSLDLSRLETAAASRGVRQAFDSLRIFSDRLQDSEPAPEELAKWSQKTP
jgi:hypothetical protein